MLAVGRCLGWVSVCVYGLYSLRCRSTAVDAASNGASRSQLGATSKCITHRRAACFKQRRASTHESGDQRLTNDSLHWPMYARNTNMR
jgi:hypothetical protein